MNEYVKSIEEQLSEEGKHFLQSIYEPKVVLHPLSHAYHSLCVTDDGEIRVYGIRTVREGEGEDMTRIADYADPKRAYEGVYHASRDGGISWQLHRANPKALGPAFKNPRTGRWMVAHVGYEYGTPPYMTVDYSDIGPDDEHYHSVRVNIRSVCHRPPLFLTKKNRVIISAQCQNPDAKTPSDNHACMHISDDNGESWKTVHLSPAPRFVPEPPHKGPRWENPGLEPSVAELSDGTLLCMLRTSQDFFYASYSYDHGDSWTVPAPTPFHGVLTNPYLFTLNDGRLLWIFNNTKPLPEEDLGKVFPPLDPDTAAGVWEDVFTNRDANCVAISEDDGASFLGFREMARNEIRNTCDFRTSGGNASGNDKSVHQFQAVELPFGKVLVHYGQHDRVARVCIFDTRWLYETARRNDLRQGMDDFSTQVYLKSISGGGGNFPGHCAWNRTNGVVPVPDPSGDRSEVLFMRNTADPVLYNQQQGVVWNFPASRTGEVTVRMLVRGRGARVSLLDFWMNPCDETVADFADFTTVIAKADCAGRFTDVTLRYDTVRGQCEVLLDGAPKATLPMQAPAPNGLCYLHLSCATVSGDAEGTLLKYFEKK